VSPPGLNHLPSPTTPSVLAMEELLALGRDRRAHRVHLSCIGANLITSPRRKLDLAEQGGVGNSGRQVPGFLRLLAR